MRKLILPKAVSQLCAREMVGTLCHVQPPDREVHATTARRRHRLAGARKLHLALDPLAFSPAIMFRSFVELIGSKDRATPDYRDPNSSYSIFEIWKHMSDSIAISRFVIIEPGTVGTITQP